MKFYRGVTAVAMMILLLSPLKAAAGKAELPEADLKRLNNVMGASDIYMREKMAHVDSITKAFRAVPATDYHKKWEDAMHLTREYLPLRADSALQYAEISLQLADNAGHPQCQFDSKIALINALATAGIFTRAKDEFEKIDSSTLTPENKISYWLSGRKLYGYMRVYVQGDPDFFNDYNVRYLQYDDSLISHLPENNRMRTFYLAERAVNEGRNAEGRKMLEALLKSLKEEDNLYGMTAFQLGLVCKNEGNPTGYASYMALAAISDIKGCVKDGLALPALADWLYQQGELNDAFKYINFALQDATTGNVRMRTVTIASLLPVIDEAYRERINASRDELMIYFLLVAFLFVLSVGLIVMLLRIVKRSREKTRQLAKTANMQESYIGHFIGLSSTYANKLDALQKLVMRKIASGQSEELLKLVKSGKFGDDQNEEFYKIFDAAFLNIYPGFIASVNALLRPEEKIELKKEGELTPELRIYGFVRLGVDESTKIAQILNYSVSTVYAYRNRMRNKAISRDTFDADVMAIGKNDNID